MQLGKVCTDSSVKSAEAMVSPSIDASDDDKLVLQRDAQIVGHRTIECN